MAEIRPKRIKLDSGRAINIRCPIPLDADPILDFVKEVLTGADWSAIQPHEFNFSFESEIKWIEDHRDSPGKLMLIAESGREIIGLLDFTNGVRERNRHVGTFGMSVRKDWRSLGIGQALLQTLLDWARTSTLIEKVSLMVFSTNKPAISLYRQMGFVEEGRQNREYRLSDGRYADGILMYQFTGNI